MLEVNPRASRTVPFVAKTIGLPIAKIAARIMAGEKLDPAIGNYGARRDITTLNHIAVKEAVFPFSKFPGVDTLLGPEMRSTGEVMGWDRNFPRAFLKAQLGAGVALPHDGRVFISVKDADKTDEMVETAQIMRDMGFTIMATSGTAKFLNDAGIETEVVRKQYEGGRTIVDIMKDGLVQLVMNTTEGAQAVEDSRTMRSVALYDKIPYFTTAAASHAAARAMQSRLEGDLEVEALQSA